MKQRVILSHDIGADIAAALEQCERDRLFVLTDENSLRLCWPKLAALDVFANARMITIPAGDTNKTVETAATVWQALVEGGATRHSCLVNLGGGMVTDLGGFAASTFKRGINFVNIPTTLLSLVDASVGGKTGVNFGSLKNEVGVFSDSKFVILSTVFLDTLDTENMLSGYAEMLKHGLISDLDTWAELLRFDPVEPDLQQLQAMVAKSVGVKERIVEADPFEHGIRKALNVGHTAGHAIESWAMRHGRPMLHGCAVAHGIVCELYLSSIKTGFPTEPFRQTVSFIREHYGRPMLTCNDYDEVIALMHHDKKNVAGTINFTLLGGIGDIRINCTAEETEIAEALDFLCF